jgi:hypothetical protein
VGTIIPILEKVTGTSPLPIVKSDSMDIILALKSDFKGKKLNTPRFLSIASGFGDLVNPT